MLPPHLKIIRPRMHLIFISYTLTTLGSDAEKRAIDPAVACLMRVVDRLSTDIPLLDHGSAQL
jgi:hypothetical protein